MDRALIGWEPGLETQAKASRRFRCNAAATSILFFSCRGGEVESGQVRSGQGCEGHHDWKIWGELMQTVKNHVQRSAELDPYGTRIERACLLAWYMQPAERHLTFAGRRQANKQTERRVKRQGRKGEVNNKQWLKEAGGLDSLFSPAREDG